MRLIQEEYGISTIWFVLILLILIAFTGVAIDTGYGVWTGQQLQIGADASALGGGREVKADVPAARAKAAEVGFANVAAGEFIQLDLNVANAAGGDIVVGRYDRSTQTFDPLAARPNAIKVVARKTDTSLNGALSLLFGPIFGYDTWQLTRHAIAMTKGGIGVGVIALDSSQACSIDIRGTAGLLSIEGGAIYVNSDNPDAACHAGQPSVVADEMYIVGGSDGGFDTKVNFDGDLYYDADPVPDPLALLPEPNWDPANDLGAILVDEGATITVTPGYYSGGFMIRNGTLNVMPGIYILDGVGLDDNGGNLFADGVMFYIVDSTLGDATESSVNLRGNGIIQITGMVPLVYPDGPAIDPELANISVPIFQARDNTNDSRILGTNDFSLDGTIYMPSNHLEIGGTSENFATGLIANTIEAHGNGLLQINYQDQFARLPAIVFLVE